MHLGLPQLYTASVYKLYTRLRNHVVQVSLSPFLVLRSPTFVDFFPQVSPPGKKTTQPALPPRALCAVFPLARAPVQSVSKRLSAAVHSFLSFSWLRTAGKSAVPQLPHGTEWGVGGGDIPQGWEGARRIRTPLGASY